MRSKLRHTTGYAPPRNHEAVNPLLRKGGPHGKTRKAERHHARQDLARSMRRGEGPLRGGA